MHEVSSSEYEIFFSHFFSKIGANFVFYFCYSASTQNEIQYMIGEVSTRHRFNF